MISSKTLKFADEPGPSLKKGHQITWKILIVDDEIDVYRTTSRILGDLTIFDRPLQFYCATTKDEAVKHLKEHPDFAVVFLDIMMEQDDTGFQMIDHIRNILKNRLVQILIQTGQPGFAPENTLISEFNINNYLDKSSLTAQKLYTAVVSSLRTYQLTLSLQNEITAHKETVGKVQVLKQEAEEASLTKSRFLANITHELKTPMHAILGFSNLGIRKYDKLSIEKIYNYFMTINSSGHQLLDLLNNLLDLSKLDVGKMDYLMRKNSVNEVVEMIVTEFHPVFIKYNFTTDIEYLDHDCKCVFDLYKIAQVLRNLISNAIKFSGGNPYLKLSISNKALNVNGASLKTACITVMDKGVGVPEKEKEKIFEKFYESSRTQTEAGGKGLGLAICQKIISAHEGKIWVEANTDGIGSKFSFIIPHNLKAKSFFSGHN